MEIDKQEEEEKEEKQEQENNEEKMEVVQKKEEDDKEEEQPKEEKKVEEKEEDEEKKEEEKEEGEKDKEEENKKEQKEKEEEKKEEEKDKEEENKEEEKDKEEENNEEEKEKEEGNKEEKEQKEQPEVVQELTVAQFKRTLSGTGLTQRGRPTKRPTKFTPEDSKKRGREPSKVLLKCPLSDPLSQPPASNVNAFTSWMKQGLKQNHKNGNVKMKYRDGFEQLSHPYSFSICSVHEKTWFYFLWHHAHWLNDEHINVAFYYIRRRRKYFSANTSFTTTDSYFSQYLLRAYEAFKSCENPDEFDWSSQSSLFDYILGSFLKCSWPWVDVDRIYIPHNTVRLEHWVLLVISIRERTITVYDSLAGKKNELVLDSIECFAQFLPLVLCHMSVFDSLGLEDNSSAPFTVVFDDNMPEQENGGDCGMFVIKSAELLTNNIPLTLLRQENMHMYRQKLCVELYKHASIKVDQKCDSSDDDAVSP